MTGAVTRQYHFPPAGLTAPPAGACSPEELLGVASRACHSSSDLGALQGSPEHLRRICELLGALHKHVVEQGFELEDKRLRLSVAERMVSGARDQVAIVRGSLGVEVAAHRDTKQKAEQEHELRIAAEEELRQLSERHVRDSARLARAMRLLGHAFDRTRRVVGTLLDLSGDGDVTCPTLCAVDTRLDVCSDEKIVVDVDDVDVLEAWGVATEPWIWKEDQNG